MKVMLGSDLGVRRRREGSGEERLSGVCVIQGLLPAGDWTLGECLGELREALRMEGSRML